MPSNQAPAVCYTRRTNTKLEYSKMLASVSKMMACGFDASHAYHDKSRFRVESPGR